MLYVVATPIGNLDDISLRARAVLAAAAVVAAEDTRRTRQLLAHLGIAPALVALHEHNEAERAGQLLDRVAAGAAVALVSDAGTPLISDPGYRLVAAARERGLPVTAVPGSCAAVAALSIAGLPTDRFHFEGFLPARAAARRARLGTLGLHPDTMVFYESVHRVGESLGDMAAAFGADRPAFVARELTKLHETAYCGTLAAVRAAVADDPGGDKGEFTIVVAGAPDTPAGAPELARVVAVLAAELPAGQVAQLAAKLTGCTRREAYDAALRAGRRDGI
jgi:16S rRNA (cytidine1402-2'-O)-methyltransferase